MLLLLVLFLTALVPDRAQADEARLLLCEPEARESVQGLLPLVHVAGRIARGTDEPLDLAIALDVSESVFLPADFDVDGDGVAGRLRVRSTRHSDGSVRQVRGWTTDAGDTVFEAARTGARRALGSLRGENARAALLSFGEETRVRARLGAPGRAREALEAMRAPADPRATDLARAIRVATSLLEAYRGDGRRKVLLLFSDGHATRPGAPAMANVSALRAARAAARHGVEIHSVAFGPDAAGPRSSYASLAESTGGSFATARELGGLLAALPHPVLAESVAELEIANATSGEHGRALRLAADGRFDAFVPLVPGPNRLSVRALTRDGSSLVARRTVYFDPPRAATAGDRALVRALRLRSLEIELAGFAATGSGVGGRLEIEPER